MTRSDVKVGDKVRVVNPWGTQGQYKKGDVLTVEQTLGNSIITKEVSRLLVSSEYELYEPIKVGDTVTLIDKPWETAVWKGMDRWFKTGIIKTKNTTWKVKNISKGNYIGQYIDCDDSPNKSPWKIPLELLRKVEDKLPDLDKLTPMARGPHPEIKAGTKFVCVKDNLDFKRGDTATLYLNDNTGMPRFKPGGWALWENFAPLEPIKHRFSDEQVAEAQRIIGEIVAGFKFGQCYYIRDESKKHLTIRYTSEIADGMHTFTAHCSPHDEFNRTIGVMVALCKAVGRKLPDWV